MNNTILLIVKGFIIGFSLAAPVGPLALLCIQRTISWGLSAGLLTGLGIALADAFYGMIAVFGVTIVSDFLIANKMAFSFAGGAFIAWLGIKMLLTKTPKAVRETKAIRQSSLRNAVTAFFLTLSNPLTVLAFIAIFSSAAMTRDSASPAVAFLVTLAIFAGSMAWWVVLSGIVAMTKTKMRPKHMHWVNVGSGLVLVTFGLYAAISAFV